MKKLTRSAKFMLALLGIIVLVGLGIAWVSDQGARIAKGSLLRHLEDQVTRLERDSEFRCADIHQGIRQVISMDVSPMLENYKIGGEWKTGLDKKVRRLEQLSELGEACYRLQLALVQFGSTAGNSISQNIMVEISTLPVFTREVHVAETCDLTCVSIHMNLIEASRDSLVKELRLEF